MNLIHLLISLLIAKIIECSNGWVHKPVIVTLRRETFKTTTINLQKKGKLVGYRYRLEDTAGPGYAELTFLFAAPDKITIKSNQCTVNIARSKYEGEVYNEETIESHNYPIEKDYAILVSIGTPLYIEGKQYHQKNVYYTDQVAYIIWSVQPSWQFP